MEDMVSTGEVWDGIGDYQMYTKVSGIDKIYAVIGSLHISSTNEGMKVAEFLRRLGVKLVSPCHCTHAKAKIRIIRGTSEIHPKLCEQICKNCSESRRPKRSPPKEPSIC